MTSEEKKEWQKEIKRQLGIVLGGFFALLFIFLVGYVLSYFSFWTWWMSVIWLIFLGVYTIYMLLFKFAPEGIFVAQVEEGTGKVVMKLGQAAKGLIQYKDHILMGLDWDVVPGQEEHLLGGLRWVGIWPIYYIYKYILRWTSVRETEETVSHEEELDSTLFKEKIYHLRLTGAEDKDGIPIDVDILLTGSVVKLYKALFGPHNYLEQVLNRTRPLFREYVRKYSFMELSAQKQRAGGELWEKLEQEKMVNTFDEHGDIQELGEFERDYGFRVKDGGIEMKNITPPKEYQEAQTRKYKAEREAERLAGEIAGTVVNSMANFYGISPDQIREKFHKNTKLQKEAREKSEEIAEKLLLADRGAYKRFEVSRIGGGKGEEGVLDRILSMALSIIAGQKDMPTGGKREEKESKIKRKSFSAEDLKRRLKKGENITQDLENFSKEVLEEEEEE